MGNHHAGTAIAIAADIGWPLRSGQSAIEVLDRICDPWRGCDAEFDGYRQPSTPLGKLLIAAFAPGQTFDDSDEGWDTEVVEPFRKRYDFC